MVLKLERKLPLLLLFGGFLKQLFLILSITFAIHCNVFGQGTSQSGIRFRPKLNLDSPGISTADHIAFRALIKGLLFNNEKTDLINEIDRTRTPHIKPVSSVTLKMSGTTTVQLSQNQSNEKRILSDSGLFFQASTLDLKMEPEEKAEYVGFLSRLNASQLLDEYNRIRLDSEQAIVALANLSIQYLRTH